jgi:hypothetical protein
VDRDTCCKALSLDALGTIFDEQLSSNNASLALNTLRIILASTTAAGDATRGDIRLIVVSNLNKVASLPNSTATRRLRIATMLSESLFDLADAGGAEEGATGSSSVGNQILAKTAQVVVAVVTGAADSGTDLATATAQQLIESASSALLSTTSSASGDSTTDADRQAVAAAVEAVARATNRSTPYTSIAARSVAFTRKTIGLSSLGGGAGGTSTRTTSVDVNAYEYDAAAGGQGTDEEDLRGLARPSAVAISSSLVQGGASGGGSGVNAYVFQYGQATNPYSSQTASDVVVVQVETNSTTNVGRRERILNVGDAVLGDVSVEMVPRNTNRSLQDECKAVYDVETSGTTGLGSALTDVCGRWNGSSFEPMLGCKLVQAKINSTAGTWSVQCECAVDKTEMKSGVVMALVGYTFDR